MLAESLRVFGPLGNQDTRLIHPLVQLDNELAFGLIKVQQRFYSRPALANKLVPVKRRMTEQHGNESCVDVALRKRLQSIERVVREGMVQSARKQDEQSLEQSRFVGRDQGERPTSDVSQ